MFVQFVYSQDCPCTSEKIKSGLGNPLWPFVFGILGLKS